MKVLGIDPGLATTGWGVVKEEKEKILLESAGAIKTQPGLPFPQRLKLIYEKIQEIIQQYNPEIMAIEELFFAKNVKTALGVGHSRGVALLCAAQEEIKICEYTPLQVKQAVVGYGRAEKQQVEMMVNNILGLHKDFQSDDIADALAVAICCVHSQKLNDILS